MERAFPYSSDWVQVDDGVIWVCPMGALDIPTILRLMDDVLAHPGFVVGMPALWDLRAASLKGVAETGARTAASVARSRTAERGRSRLAVVVSSEEDYATVLVYRHWAAGGPNDTRIVRDIDAGIAWARDGQEP